MRTLFLALMLSICANCQQVDWLTNIKNRPPSLVNQKFDWVTNLINKPVRDIRNYGNTLTGTGKQAYSGHMTSGSTTFTLSDSNFDTFTASDVGRNILISGSCSDVCQLWSSIVSVISPTQVILNDPAPGTSTNISEVYWWNPAQDDTLFIQNAINDSTNISPIVYLPHGVYVVNNVNTPLTYQPAMRAMNGDGRQSTVIIPNNSSYSSRTLRFLDVNHFLLKGMTFRGPGINGIFGGGLSFDLNNMSNIENLRLEDIEVRNVASGGIFMNTPILSSLHNVKVVLAAGIGFNFFDPVSVTCEQCYSITNVGEGFLVNTGADWNCDGCAAESDGIGYHIMGATNVSIKASDAEAMLHRAPSAPASFPAAAVVAGGGIPAGNYLLKYTWVRQFNASAINLESTASPESLVQTTAGGNLTIQFTLPIAPTDAPLVTSANIYITPTNGASGTEGFEKNVAVSSSGTTLVSLTSFSAPGSAPPTVSLIGHAYVVDNCTHVHIDTDNSRKVPTLDAFHLWVTNASDDVQIDAFRALEGPSVPTTDIQFDAGVTNVRFAGNLSGLTFLNSGINTIVTDRGTIKANIFDAGTGLRINSLAPSRHVPCGNGTNYIDCTLAFTDLSGAATLAQEVAAGAVGQVQFNGGTTFNASTRLFWDDTNKFLGVTNTAPIVDLTVGGAEPGTALAMQHCLVNNAAGGGTWCLGSSDNGNASGGGRFLINNANSTGSPALTIDSSKRVGILQKTPAFALDVTGQVNATTGHCMSANVCWTSGAGVPAAGTCVVAKGGSLYSRTDGTTTTSLYVCDNATGVWTAK